MPDADDSEGGCRKTNEYALKRGKSGVRQES